MRITSDEIGGLSGQIEKINKRLESLANHSGTESGYRRPANSINYGGILLYGQQGVGKSLLLNKLANAPWRKSYILNREVLGSYQKDRGKALSSTAAEAKAFQPSIFVIDQLENILRGDEETCASLTDALMSLFEHLRGSRVLVVAATSKLQGIDKRLRSSRAFNSVIELPIPDAVARTDIFRVLLETNLPDREALAEKVGLKTHGYVGQDLVDLYISAIDRVEERLGSSKDIESHQNTDDSGDKKTHDGREGKAPEMKVHSMAELLTDADIADAMSEVRPSAMKEVFLETPKVYWSDIGGSEKVQKALYPATVRPFKVGLSQIEIRMCD